MRRGEDWAHQIVLIINVTRCKRLFWNGDEVRLRSLGVTRGKRVRRPYLVSGLSKHKGPALAYLHFQREGVRFSIGAMKGDEESGINLSQGLVAEDVHFHLVMVDWRETRRVQMKPTY